MLAAGRKVLPLLLVGLLAVMFAPHALASAGTVKVAQNATLGTILTDSEGRTLYRFTKDVVNVSSVCYNRCAVAWPPLLVDDGNPVAGEGVDGNLLGVVQRTDGTRQVMYNGMPLYYFDQDATIGDTKGQRVGDVWFIIHPNSTTVGNQPVMVRERQHPSLGTFLTDDAGKTLYLFTKDHPKVTVCYDRCAAAWPPLLVGTNEPQLAPGMGGALGTIVRDDGNRQVTYNDTPLYYFTPDTAIGDTKGQGVGNVWYVIPPVAAPAAAPAAPTGAAPATAGAAPTALPNTGGDNGQPGVLVALALLLIAVSGGLRFVVRRTKA